MTFILHMIGWTVLPLCFSRDFFSASHVCYDYCIYLQKWILRSNIFNGQRLVLNIIDLYHLWTFTCDLLEHSVTDKLRFKICVLYTAYLPLIISIMGVDGHGK